MMIKVVSFLAANVTDVPAAAAAAVNTNQPGGY